MVAKKVCILITSYQSGRLFVIGAEDNGGVVLQQHQFDRAMGISAYQGGFVFATLHQLWRYSLMNPMDKASNHGRPLLLPQACFYTGFVNCHDVAQLPGGDIIYASTLFNCVAKAALISNFEPVWAPPFIKELVPEDRCHVNGLAVDNGKLRFVSVLGESAKKGGWRDDLSQGVIFDMRTNRVIASNLWMPHSPRVRDRRLYALESGRGSFGTLNNGKISEQLLLPGYPRGLDFCERTAAIGYSRPRPGSGDKLPLSERLKASGIEAGCGVVLYETSTSKVFHSIHFPAGVDEIYDVAFLHGTSNPRLIHPASNEMIKTYSVRLKTQRKN